MSSDDADFDPGDLRSLLQEMRAVLRANADSLEEAGLVPFILDKLISQKMPLVSDEEYAQLPLPRVEIRDEPSEDENVACWRLALVLRNADGRPIAVTIAQSEVASSGAARMTRENGAPINNRDLVEARSLMLQLGIPGFVVVGNASTRIEPGG